MPRKPRELVEGGIYHLYNRALGGAPVFEDPFNVQVFLDLFREIKQRDNWTVFAWCLMPNHYHLVLRCGVAPLPRGMRSLDGRFSQRYNRVHRRLGPFWQHRYKSRFVSDEDYLRQVIVYVHLNPIRAGISSSPVDYPLSGHREIMVTTPSGLADMDQTLLVFGDTVFAGRHYYSESLAAGYQADFTKLVESSLWGNDVERELVPTAAASVDHLGRSTGPDRPTVRPELFVLSSCELLNIDVQRITGRKRDPVTAWYRRLIATVGIERWRQKSTDLGTVLNKNPDVVRRWASLGSRLRSADDSWAVEIEDLDIRLIEFWRDGSGLTS
jgi:REP element-mobilizing transposase RayT